MRKLSVMIVDDERVIVDGFLQLVNWSKIGCEVVATAYDGVMAINEILRLKPDIVVIDINMPLLNGLDAVKKVSKELSKTAFIIVSGYDNFDYVREALMLRVADYLLKPVDFDLFEALIERIRRERFDFSSELLSEANDETFEAPVSLPMINRIVAYVNDHLAGDLRLKTLAAEFYMNPYYLSQYFKSKTGMNYYAYITHLRIERAKRLLDTTDMRIADIAMHVGFNEYRTFTKIFNKIEGQSPSDYKRNNQFS